MARKQQTVRTTLDDAMIAGYGSIEVEDWRQQSRQLPSLAYLVARLTAVYSITTHPANPTPYAIIYDSRTASETEKDATFPYPGYSPHACG